MKSPVAVRVRVKPGHCLIVRGTKYRAGSEFEIHIDRLPTFNYAVEVVEMPEMPRYRPRRSESRSFNRLEKTALNRGGV